MKNNDINHFFKSVCHHFTRTYLTVHPNDDDYHHGLKVINDITEL